MSRQRRDPIEQIEFMRNLLAFSLVGAFIWCIPLFVFKTIPSANEQIITYMAGQLSGMATLALGFYFVSKIGQDALDNKRAENTGKLADAVTTAVQASAPVTPPDAAAAADQVAHAAESEAEKIKGAGA